MTCEVCDGKRDLPLLDIWKSIKDMKDKKGFYPHWVPGFVGCYMCDHERLHEVLMALVDKNGEPFTDKKIREEGYHMQRWDSPPPACQCFMMICPGKP